MSQPQRKAGAVDSVGTDSVLPPAKTQQVDLTPYLIRFYRSCVVGVMLDRIAMFGSDPSFQAICKDLAKDTGMTNMQASEHLWPLSNRIYRAAEAATHD